jgi:hypothetical protein
MVHLRQPAQQRNDQNEAECRPEQRESDAQESLRGAGTIDPRCVQQFLRNTGEAGQEEQHVVARVLPHRNGDNRAQCERRITKPVGLLNPERRQVVIQQSCAGQEDKDEQRCRSDHRNQHRQRDQRAQQARQARRFPQADRERQREHQAGSNGTDGVDQIVEGRPAEMDVCEQTREIADSPVLGAAKAPHGQRDGQYPQHGPVRKAEQKHRRWRQQSVRG